MLSQGNKIKYLRFFWDHSFLIEGQIFYQWYHHFSGNWVSRFSQKNNLKVKVVSKKLLTIKMTPLWWTKNSSVIRCLLKVLFTMEPILILHSFFESTSIFKQKKKIWHPARWCEKYRAKSRIGRLSRETLKSFLGVKIGVTARKNLLTSITFPFGHFLPMKPLSTFTYFWLIFLNVDIKKRTFW